jgi:hypothetical protein
MKAKVYKISISESAMDYIHGQHKTIYELVFEDKDKDYGDGNLVINVVNGSINCFMDSKRDRHSTAVFCGDVDVDWNIFRKAEDVILSKSALDMHKEELQKLLGNQPSSV